MGGHPSKGLKKGVVVNIEATVSAIQRALEEADRAFAQRLPGMIHVENGNKRKAENRELRPVS